MVWLAVIVQEAHNLMILVVMNALLVVVALIVGVQISFRVTLLQVVIKLRFPF